MSDFPAGTSPKFSQSGLTVTVGFPGGVIIPSTPVPVTATFAVGAPALEFVIFPE